jgi:two-component system CheB/CheR fusion protein
MRRMALHTQQSLAEYAERLKVDHAEAEALYQDLLINVTSFFRDAELFEALKASVFPELAKGRSPTQPLRIWVPGCSTGQEGYSLAMALIEFFDDKPVCPPIQIFATDLDQSGLDKARTGIYPEGIEGEVSPERLRRFFKRDDHVYRIEKSIRDMCVFARHNVAADPPFSHVDLISCRNVLIYLATPLQKRVLSAFHYALNIPGYVALGSAETVGDYGDLFQLTDRSHRIYLKKAVSSRHLPLFHSGDYRPASFISGRPGPGVIAIPDFQKEADRILLNRYAPPGVLVDENFAILQFRGRTSPYLEPPAGEPTTNVLKMAREGLFLELRNTLADAKKSNKTVRREGIRFRSNGDMREIALEVVPLRSQGGNSCYLVLFQEAGAIPAAVPPKSLEPLPSTEAEAAGELLQLRQELVATREYLHSMIEQQDAANEELRSANEEIMSSNEELQSTNEEVETAKEELQSANEELTTVNEQLQRRNIELDQANNDLTNLLSSTSIPIVMIGGDLRLRRFNSPAKKVMNLLPTDIGRPISDLNVGAVAADLEHIVGDVIESVQPVEREVRDRDGRWYMMRVQPYRTADHKIDGAVVVLVDINEVRSHQEELRRQSTLLELSQDAVIVRDAENRVIFWNSAAQQMYGWSADEAGGMALNELLQTDSKAWTELSNQLDEQGIWEGEMHQNRRNGEPIIVQTREVLVRDQSGAPSAILSIKRDITERHRMMEALRQADRHKDEFLATLAHELRNPLAPIRNAAEIIRLAGYDPASVARVRDILDRQVKQLSRIVEDLIDITRIVEQKIELRKERVTLSTVVETALESCRSLIEVRRHRLTVNYPDEPLYLDVDPVRLAQVLINLLNNAAKYTEPGGDIRLTAKRVAVPDAADATTDGEASKAGELILTVSDNGMGILPELLPHIFDMFIQGVRAVRQDQGGLGIGLSLVRSLVQMHGGSVEARSEGPGRGSEFVVRLPLADGPPQPAAGPETAPATLQPRRILVVDDNQDQAESLGLLLKLMGHETHVAFNGQEALEAMARFKPDVALVDIGLPAMSGYELARRIRRQPQFRNIVLVAQTGWGQDADRKRSEEAGFDYHLVKPVSPELLRDLLNAPRKR